MAELTPRQREVWDLRQSGRTLPEIASFVGLSISAVSQHWRHARDRMEGKKSDGKPVEETRPGAAEMVLSASTDPTQTVKEMAELEGMPRQTATNLIQRFRIRYGGTMGELAKIKTQALEERVGILAVEILDSISEEDLKKANLYQKVLASAILIDKRQILNREPTQIISVEDRRKLPEIAAALSEEIARRENMIDVTPSSSQPVTEPVEGQYVP